MHDDVYQQLQERMGEGEPQPRLSATRRLLELLGDPQQSYPVIHLTGTNGKTSTSRIIDSILRAYGLRVGLFTSPHLLQLTERFVIDGEPISARSFRSQWADIQPYLTMVDDELSSNGESPLTFFEITTALAFSCFADAPVDVAVVEVGMGGEWDSTNVADGTVAVFTSISLDHTGRLGATLQEIAKTKSGIIKPAARVVTAKQSAEVYAELVLAAEHAEAGIVSEDEHFSVLSRQVAVGGQLISIRGTAATYTDLFLPLYGAHQAHNSAVAVAAVEAFLGGADTPLNADLVREGFSAVTSPGRLQRVASGPTVFVDAAHNPAGAAVLAAAVEEYFSWERVVVVLSVFDDKDAAGIIHSLNACADEYVITQSSSHRASDVDELASIAAAIVGTERVRVERDVSAAVQTARSSIAGNDNAAVLVTGSIALVSEVLAVAQTEGWTS